MSNPAPLGYATWDDVREAERQLALDGYGVIRHTPQYSRFRELRERLIDQGWAYHGGGVVVHGFTRTQYTPRFLTFGVDLSMLGYLNVWCDGVSRAYGTVWNALLTFDEFDQLDDVCANANTPMQITIYQLSELHGVPLTASRGLSIHAKWGDPVVARFGTGARAPVYVLHPDGKHTIYEGDFDERE